MFGDDGLTFRDVLDLVNPLQHIPLVGNLYRRMSGDILDPAIRVAGGALFGGPIGAGLAAVALAVKSFGNESDAAAPAAGGISRPRHYEARGGWMVAASRQIEIDEHPQANAAVVSREHHGPIGRRRAGWITEVYGPTAPPLRESRRIDIAA